LSRVPPPVMTMEEAEGEGDADDDVIDLDE
jgi:hypothetical protein